MVEPAPQPPTVRFGPYEADLGTGELRKDGAKVPLQDKPFQMLALLLRRPGELVTRDDLRSELWPADTFVDFEHGLNTAVKKLRQALDDSAETPRFVETLPKRGYRFVAPVTPEAPRGYGDGAGEPATDARLPSEPGLEAGPRAASASAPPGKPWRLHGPWAVVVIVLVGLLLWPHRRAGDVDPAPPPNPRPVIVLMDSPLSGRVYDPRTAAAGGTNADDLTDALRDLPVVIEKENTSAMWHREDQVLRQNPDLIVSHLSCLLDERIGKGQEEVYEHLFALAVNRLMQFFGYLAALRPQTRFLIYSRGALADPGEANRLVGDAEARFPSLRGRIEMFNVPGGHDHATFRDPNTARLIRERVKAILKLP